MVAVFHAAVSAFCFFSLVSAGGGCFPSQPLLKSRKLVHRQTTDKVDPKCRTAQLCGSVIICIYCKVIQTVSRLWFLSLLCFAVCLLQAKCKMLWIKALYPLCLFVRVTKSHIKYIFHTTHNCVDTYLLNIHTYKNTEAHVTLQIVIIIAVIW